MGWPFRREELAVSKYLQGREKDAWRDGQNERNSVSNSEEPYLIVWAKKSW